MTLGSVSLGSAFAVPFFVAAGLLVLAGAAKLLRPEGASRAMAAAGLPRHPLIARGLGSLEIAAGGACLAAPRPGFAAAMAALYLVFAAFLTHLILRRIPGASCGCLGSRDSPPTRVHVLLNLTAAAAGAFAAFDPPPGLVTFTLSLPLHGLPFLVGAACAAYLAYLSVSLLPQISTRR